MSADLLSDAELTHWIMSGEGGFRPAPEGGVESFGGPGIFWYQPREFGDFVLTVEWRLSSIEDNSGVFLRFPALGRDWRPAVDNGFEVQIDDRGVDPETGRTGSPLHLTGAVYRLAAAERLASRPVGQWNRFEITVEDGRVAIVLNDIAASRLDRETGRPPHGHVGLQNHHDGSRVQFRNLRIVQL